MVAIFTVGVCYSDWGFVSYREIYFESIDELYDYIHADLPINRDEILNREYDSEVEFESNYAYAKEAGNPVSATQKVPKTIGEDNFEFYYEYLFKHDEEQDDYIPELDYVYFIVNGETLYKQYTIYFYTGDVIIYFSSYNLSSSIEYDDDREQYYVDESCDEYFYGVVGASICGSVMGLFLIGGAAAFTTLKIKNRREKNVG